MNSQNIIFFLLFELVTYFVQSHEAKPQICAQPTAWGIDLSNYTQLADPFNKTNLLWPMQKTSGSVSLVALVNAS